MRVRGRTTARPEKAGDPALDGAGVAGWPRKATPTRFVQFSRAFPVPNRDDSDGRGETLFLWNGLRGLVQRFDILRAAFCVARRILKHEGRLTGRRPAAI